VLVDTQELLIILGYNGTILAQQLILFAPLFPEPPASGVLVPVGAPGATESLLATSEGFMADDALAVWRAFQRRSDRLAGFSLPLLVLVASLASAVAELELEPEKLCAAEDTVPPVGDGDADFQEGVIRWQCGYVKAGSALEPSLR
jgi:hypothetical protein